MSDDRIEQFVRKTAGEYHRPPETPREAMWAAIERQRREGGQVRQGRGIATVWRTDQWVRWGIGIAAALLLGVSIGRFWGDGAGVSESPVVVTGVGESPAVTARDLYRVVAVRHLGNVETFLTGFRVDARAGRLGLGAGTTAKDLMTTTRLLLGSPAAADPQLHMLLEDVELVLAQIAQFPRERQDQELELIDDGIDQRSVMLRLQAAIAADLTLSGQGVL